mgnify:CR=1 FL=1
MDSKLMLFECIECEETYLADNLCDGYNCPKCNGHIVPKGFIKEIEEGIKDVQNKIKRAKKNGLIRKYNNSPKPKLPPNPNKYLYGVDLSNKKDITVTISFNSEEFHEDLIERVTKELESQRRNIGSYIQCKYE